MNDTISVQQLPSGYWHIRGRGSCNWAQPPIWPCDEATLRAHAFPQASELFLSLANGLARPRGCKKGCKR